MRDGSRYRGSFALWLGALAFSACRSTEAREFEAEVSSLDRKIDALREAPNEGKAPLLAALQQAPCERPPVCELKRVCVDAYTTHLSVVDAAGRARALLAQTDGGPAASIQAAQELALADRDLARSKELTGKCASDQGELRRKSRER